MADAPFPLPAHRTGRADFPHPALGQGPTADAHEKRRRQRWSRIKPNSWYKSFSGNREFRHPCSLCFLASQ